MTRGLETSLICQIAMAKRGKKNNDWELTTRIWMNLVIKKRNTTPREFLREEI